MIILLYLNVQNVQFDDWTSDVGFIWKTGWGAGIMTCDVDV